MLMKVKRGKSLLPRVAFEVHPAIKEAILEKCHIEGSSLRTVGNFLFKQWLAIPANPEDRISREQCQKNS